MDSSTQAGFQCTHNYLYPKTSSSIIQALPEDQAQYESRQNEAHRHSQQATTGMPVNEADSPEEDGVLPELDLNMNFDEMFPYRAASPLDGIEYKIECGPDDSRTQLIQTLEGQHDQITHLETNVDVHAAEKTTLRNRIAELEDKNAALEAQSTILRTQVARLQDKNENLRTKLANRKARLSLLEKREDVFVEYVDGLPCSTELARELENNTKLWHPDRVACMHSWSIIETTWWNEMRKEWRKRYIARGTVTTELGKCMEAEKKGMVAGRQNP